MLLLLQIDTTEQDRTNDISDLNTKFLNIRVMSDKKKSIDN